MLYWMAPLLYLPGLMPLWQWLYRKFAKTRYRFGGSKAARTALAKSRRGGRSDRRKSHAKARRRKAEKQENPRLPPSDRRRKDSYNRRLYPLIFSLLGAPRLCESFSCFSESTSTHMSEFRIEKDTMGEVKVPAQAYYASQTQRAVENFPISGKPLPKQLIRAMAW